MRASALTTLVLAAACSSSPAPPPKRCPAPPASTSPHDSAASGIVPFSITRRQNQRIEFGPHAIEVDPVDGGRIVEFSLNGRSVIASREESPVAYGSSLWPSPQQAWTWPPPAEFDQKAWAVTTAGRTLSLQSRTSERLGMAARQRIWAEPERGRFVLEVALQNRSETAVSAAAWRNTRVRPKGLTFFPARGPTLPHSAFELAPANGIVWFRHEPAVQRENAKIFADGEEGWLAHVDGDLLFVQRFENVPRDALAPGEGEIEIYVDGAGGFVEIEAQGPYGSIAPGAETSWTSTWSLRRLPPGVSATPGSGDLVALAREAEGRSD